jgi:hypothetical protein
MTKDDFLLLLGEVKTLIRDQIYRQPPNTMLALIELLEAKKMSDYLSIRTYALRNDSEYVVAVGADGCFFFLNS